MINAARLLLDLVFVQRTGRIALRRSYARPASLLSQAWLLIIDWGETGAQPPPLQVKSDQNGFIVGVSGVSVTSNACWS
ncbi:hypothetical protein [Sinorhizobium fredii]|uniref:hypothetical protein n=1 Tax=Rhizobium fredii TaxID=380 RepID=UPI00065E9E93|nr:hypothetical protein [Sinorhizobium fredii]